MYVNEKKESGNALIRREKGKEKRKVFEDKYPNRLLSR